MYTVVRFTSQSSDANLLTELGKLINTIRPGSFRKLAKQGFRFAIEICDANQWAMHLSKIDDFLLTFDTVLGEAQRLKVDLMLDIAIETADLVDHNTLIVGLPYPLARRIGNFDIEFRVSIYNVDEIGKA